MKTSEVEIGKVYLAKVSNKICRVRITGQKRVFSQKTRGYKHLFFTAQNLETGRYIQIVSGMKLRREVEDDGKTITLNSYSDFCKHLEEGSIHDSQDSPRTDG